MDQFNLVQINNCRSKARFTEWKKTGGALLGRTDLGCGLNALAFLSIFTRVQGESLLQKIKPTGTSFNEIIRWIQLLNGFNNKYTEFVFPITTVNDITIFFNKLSHDIDSNTCVIAKLNRHYNIDKRSVNCKRFTIGHTVVFSKEENGDMYTIDPQQGTRRKRNDVKMAKSYFDGNCYISISLVAVQNNGYNLITPVRPSIVIPRNINKDLATMETKNDNIVTVPMDESDDTRVYMDESYDMPVYMDES